MDKQMDKQKRNFGALQEAAQKKREVINVDDSDDEVCEVRPTRASEDGYGVEESLSKKARRQDCDEGEDKNQDKNKDKGDEQHTQDTENGGHHDLRDCSLCPEHDFESGQHIPDDGGDSVTHSDGEDSDDSDVDAESDVDVESCVFRREPSGAVTFEWSSGSSVIFTRYDADAYPDANDEEAIAEHSQFGFAAEYCSAHDVVFNVCVMAETFRFPDAPPLDVNATYQAKRVAKSIARDLLRASRHGAEQVFVYLRSSGVRDSAFEAIDKPSSDFSGVCYVASVSYLDPKSGEATFVTVNLGEAAAIVFLPSGPDGPGTLDVVSDVAAAIKGRATEEQVARLACRPAYLSKLWPRSEGGSFVRALTVGDHRVSADAPFVSSKSGGVLTLSSHPRHGEVMVVSTSTGGLPSAPKRHVMPFYGCSGFVSAERAISREANHTVFTLPGAREPLVVLLSRDVHRTIENGQLLAECLSGDDIRQSCLRLIDQAMSRAGRGHFEAAAFINRVIA